MLCVFTEGIGRNRLPLTGIDLREKRVLIYVDFNVLFDVRCPTEVIPLARSHMALAVPTIRYCIDNGAKSVVLASHSRPQPIGAYPWSVTPRDRVSFGPLAVALEGMIDRTVVFLPQCIGPAVVAYCTNPPHGTVILLEKLPDPDEENGVTAATRTAFYQVFAKLADIFVNDTFATVHVHNSDVMLGAGFRWKTVGIQMLKELEKTTQVPPFHAFVFIVAFVDVYTGVEARGAASPCHCGWLEGVRTDEFVGEDGGEPHRRSHHRWRYRWIGLWCIKRARLFHDTLLVLCDTVQRSPNGSCDANGVSRHRKTETRAPNRVFHNRGEYHDQGRGRGCRAFLAR